MKMQEYTNDLKNWEFDKEASQNFCLERATIAERQGTSPTPSKTNSSSRLCTLKKRYVTLIEMIIVITLIGIIMGALAWRYAGALDKGRAFKTETGITRLETILNIAVTEDPTLLNDLDGRWEDTVKSSPLVDDPNKLINDGWGERYQISVEQGVIHVRSRRLVEYQQGKQ